MLKLWLKLSVKLFGRWARYEVVEDTYLPVSKTLLNDTCGIYEKPRHETWLQRSVIKAWSTDEMGLNWRSRPNHAMRPLNWPARIIFSALPARPQIQKMFNPPFPPGENLVLKKARELNWAGTMYDFVETDESREIKRIVRERWDVGGKPA